MGELTIGTSVRLWRETEEDATIRDLYCILANGEKLWWVHFDSDPEEELFVYSVDESDLPNETEGQ